MMHYCKTRSTFLLTGFGPFPGVSVNISAQFANNLAKLGCRHFAKTRFVAETLPTTWREAPAQLEKLYLLYRPTFVLHFGVSKLAHSITLECRAKNCAQHLDASGNGPSMSILRMNGPAELTATIPIGRLIARLRCRAIPAVLSHDAGNYLCNAILYHSLEFMSAMKLDGQCGFVHLPTKLPQHGVGRKQNIALQQLSFETSLKGGVELLSVLLQQTPRYY